MSRKCRPFRNKFLKTSTKNFKRAFYEKGGTKNSSYSKSFERKQGLKPAICWLPYCDAPNSCKIRNTRRPAPLHCIIAHCKSAMWKKCSKFQAKHSESLHFTGSFWNEKFKTHLKNFNCNMMKISSQKSFLGKGSRISKDLGNIFHFSWNTALIFQILFFMCSSIHPKNHFLMVLPGISRWEIPVVLDYQTVQST